MCINMVNGHNQCVSIWSMDITNVCDITSVFNMVNGHNQCVSIWLMGHNQCVSIWLMDITSVYQYGQWT